MEGKVHVRELIGVSSGRAAKSRKTERDILHEVPVGYVSVKEGYRIMGYEGRIDACRRYLERHVKRKVLVRINIGGYAPVRSFWHRDDLLALREERLRPCDWQDVPAGWISLTEASVILRRSISRVSGYTKDGRLHARHFLIRGANKQKRVCGFVRKSEVKALRRSMDEKDRSLEELRAQRAAKSSRYARDKREFYRKLGGGRGDSC